jgi:putative ubiquitin-RnfH superfamily antitoxin RatB of RatAB toxin-antitoxin module
MARLRIEVMRARPERQETVALELEQGATVGVALRAAGMPLDQPVGIYGRRVALDARLTDGDRVELYRPLRIDPKEARRRRALNRTRS